MGLQARLTASRSLDVEKAPLADLPIDDSETKDHRIPSRRRAVLARLLDSLPLVIASLLLFAYISSQREFPWPSSPSPLPAFIEDGIKQCEIIARPLPSHQASTSRRTSSDRFVEGTGAVWLRNATLWTGNKDGTEILREVDVLLDGGVVSKIGSKQEVRDTVSLLKGHVEEVELEGAWVTPGIVDLHSHMGVDAAPSTVGSESTNSLKNAVLPFLRSLDGFNTHDMAFNLSISGGITTTLVLPGSAGNIGGQAFTFKPRWTKENTPQSMQVDPPFKLSHQGNGTWERTDNWRHIKHACGENPKRVYGNTRLDSAWDFRHAYDEGKKLKAKQERWCESPKTQKEPYPEDLQWEALADVIRGNVKVNIHCYETVDLNDMVRISNEFKFPIAAFHHAHETYLVPDLLKQAYGPVPPAVAIFATNARYKREAYRGSEFAPKVLADNGLNVIMKSDHPVLDSRYLVFEAAQAHHYGLNVSEAMGSVTTHPAKAMGLDHRLGYVREGYDADIVVWDSFPLTLGATPKQTYIDGIPQIMHPHTTSKPAEAQEIPPAGKYGKEAEEAVEARGDPILRPKHSAKNVIFSGVQNLYLPHLGVNEVQESDKVVVVNGTIQCIGPCVMAMEGMDFAMVDLKGGSLSKGLVSIGSPLGMGEILPEKSTVDGNAYDVTKSVADLLDGVLVRGVDGVLLDGKDELLAYRAGVTSAIAFPITSSLIAGLSFQFSTSALTPLVDGAILSPSSALILKLDNSAISVSTKIAVLRRLLHGEADEDNEVTKALQRVAKGELTVVVAVEGADAMSSLVRLKKEVAPKMKMTFLGAHESWLIADELAKEDIGVIVARARPFPGKWSQRRILPGLPLSKQSLPAYLASKGVKVALGIEESWQARNTRYDAAWEYANSPDEFSKQSALDLVSTNIEELLGLSNGDGLKEEEKGWVAWEGDVFSIQGRVKAIVAPGANTVDLF